MVHMLGAEKGHRLETEKNDRSMLSARGSALRLSSRRMWQQKLSHPADILVYVFLWMPLTFLLKPKKR